ncbi:MAG: hypothetical protein COA43_15880 [Robiginitomaculum sp.]|nr:MAG: hypothetical protein COA43_15880 [Robiginitomaculum sp.]
MHTFVAISLSFALSLPLSIMANADERVRVVSKQADSTALTIYPDNLALITETRRVVLPKGKSKLVFEGVNDRMIPASILLREFSGMVIEQNFDYALLNDASLFEKSVGKTVTLTRTHNASGKVQRVSAKIVAAGEGMREHYDYRTRTTAPMSSGKIDGVIFEINGKYEAYQCSGLSEGTRFENLPTGLTNVPELSIEVEATKAGPQDIVISYLADNFSWQADYRLDLKGDDAHANLNGWLTINNETSQSFKNTPLAIIAGTLNRSHETQAPAIKAKQIYANCWPDQSTQTPVALTETRNQYRNEIKKFGSGIMRESEPQMAYAMADVDEIIVTGSGGKRKVEQEDFGDYKLYRINEPVTVSAYQTKQVRFLKTDEAEYEKMYTLDVNLNAARNRYAGQDGLQNTMIEYRLDNSRDGKIAKPLPKGNMLVFAKAENGKTIVIGETNVVDTAIDNPMKIYLDASFLVQVNTVYSARHYSKTLTRRNRVKADVAHNIINASDLDIRVEINIPDSYKSLKISAMSQKQDSKVGANGWTVLVPANASTLLSYHVNFIE